MGIRGPSDRRVGTPLRACTRVCSRFPAGEPDTFQAELWEPGSCAGGTWTLSVLSGGGLGKPPNYFLSRSAERTLYVFAVFVGAEMVSSARQGAGCCRLSHSGGDGAGDIRVVSSPPAQAVLAPAPGLRAHENWGGGPGPPAHGLPGSVSQRSAGGRPVGEPCSGHPTVPATQGLGWGAPAPGRGRSRFLFTVRPWAGRGTNAGPDASGFPLRSDRPARPTSPCPIRVASGFVQCLSTQGVRGPGGPLGKLPPLDGRTLRLRCKACPGGEAGRVQMGSRGDWLPVGGTLRPQPPAQEPGEDQTRRGRWPLNGAAEARG